MNETLRRLFAVLGSDLWHSCALWERKNPRARAILATQRVILLPRVRAVVLFRISGVLFLKAETRWIAYLLQARILRATGAEIHPAAEIGPGLNLAHTSGIVVGRHVVIGSDALLFQGVTLGDDGTGPGQPVIGDRVRIGAGAKVLGSVQIGDDVTIAANAVVIADVPTGATVGGIPARDLARTSP
jgi:serine O-acetyltransferase